MVATFFFIKLYLFVMTQMLLIKIKVWVFGCVGSLMYNVELLLPVCLSSHLVREIPR